MAIRRGAGIKNLRNGRVPHLRQQLPFDLEIRDVGGIQPFTISLKGTGYFPLWGPARTIWVSIGDADPLALIAARLEKCLAELGFVPE